MTQIAKNTHILKTPDETLGQFTFEIPLEARRFGLEWERHTVDAATLAPTTTATALEIVGIAARNGVQMPPEGSAAMLEILNETALTAEEGPEASLSDISRQSLVVDQAVRQKDQRLLPFGVLPFADLDEICKNHIHDIPRVTTFVRGFFIKHRPANALNFTTVAGVQSSISLSTPLERLRYFNRASHLAPLLATLTSTAPPYATPGQGAATAVKTNIGLARRLGVLGDISQSGVLKGAFYGLDKVTALDAENADHFAKLWNMFTWNNPFWCYYDPEDANPDTRLKLFGDGKVESFSALPDEQKTIENYYLMGKNYGLVTLSALPATESRPAIRRIELRFMDSGSEDHARIIAGFTAALGFDPEFGEAVDTFLGEHGFDAGNPAANFDVLIENLKAAATQEFEGLEDLPYGTADMRDAARAFDRLVLKPFLERYPQLARLSALCEQGTSPALRYRTTYGDAAETFRNKLRQEFQAQAVPSTPRQPANNNANAPGEGTASPRAENL